MQDRRDGWNSYYRVTQPQVFALLDVAHEVKGIPMLIELRQRVYEGKPTIAPQPLREVNFG
ncbi:MAG: hypothetical protein KA765_12000 [Thermoflexales bacterium]|nr:hypothetical protein [Thermoflexales bacterium]